MSSIWIILFPKRTVRMARMEYMSVPKSLKGLISSCRETFCICERYQVICLKNRCHSQFWCYGVKQEDIKASLQLASFRAFLLCAVNYIRMTSKNVGKVKS